MSRVAAIMCTWNERRMVPLVIESIADFVDEIVIVDGGSTDGTRGIAREWCHKEGVEHRVYEQPDFPLRYARLYAIEQADADWYLICDGDEVFHTDGPLAIDNLQSVMDRGAGTCFRVPMQRLYLDLEHTNLEQVDPPGHKTLYSDAKTIGLMPDERDLPAYCGDFGSAEVTAKFNCGVKDRRRQFLRESVWHSWAKDADKRVPIELYAKREFGIDDIDAAADEWYENRRASDDVVEYDPDRWGYVPKVIRKWRDRGDVRGFEG